MSEVIATGASAPDFLLPSTPDQKVGLSEFRGRPVVLVFYPADWSPVRRVPQPGRCFGTGAIRD